jgi:hypothetical protein
MPSLEDARKHRNTHHRHPHGGLTPPPHHGAGSPHPPAHSSAPKNTKNLSTPPQSKRADSKTDKPTVTLAAAPRVEPLPVQAGPVAYRPSPRKDGGSSGPDLGHPFKASSVRRGDSLWRIAKRELGKGHRWRKIRTAHGSHLTERAAKRLQIGTLVYLPSNSSSQNNLSTPKSVKSSTISYSTTSYTRKPSSNLTTKPVPFVSASSGDLKSQSTSSTALVPTSQKKSGVKSAPLTSRTVDSQKTKRESSIQRSTSTKKNDFDKRSTALSSTARRNPGGQSSSLISTTGSSRTRHESGQKNSQPPASWAGFLVPVLTAQVTQSRVAQAHHVATRVGVPIAEAQSSAAFAGGVRGAVLLKSPSAVNPMVEAFGSPQVRGAAKGAFKVFAPIGIAVDAVQLRSAWKKDNGFGPNVRQAAGGAAGGWVGAAGGVELGAAIGSLVPGVGTVIGALMGGMAGAVMGSGFGKKVAERAEQSFQGEQPQQANNFSRANQYPHW